MFTALEACSRVSDFPIERRMSCSRNMGILRSLNPAFGLFSLDRKEGDALRTVSEYSHSLARRPRRQVAAWRSRGVVDDDVQSMSACSSEGLF